MPTMIMANITPASSGETSTGMVQGCTATVATAPPMSMARPVTMKLPHFSSTVPGSSV